MIKELIHDIKCDFMKYLKKNKYSSSWTLYLWFLIMSSQLFEPEFIMTTL